MSEPAIILVTALAHAVCHLGELIFAGVLVAVMTEFRLEPQEATALALPGYLLFGLGALPVGLLSDRWGPNRLLLVYLVGMAGASVAVALAPNVWTLLAALTALGLAASIYHPVGLALLSLGIHPAARGRAMGINGVAGNIGIALGPSLGLLAAQLGVWRLAYLILAALALIGVVAMHLAVRGTGAWSTAPGPPVAPARKPPVRTGGWLPLGLLFAAMMLGGLNYRCLMTALPNYLTLGGGVLVLFALAAGALGQYFAGHVADRLGARRVYPCLVGLLAPLALLLAAVGPTPAGFVCASLLAVCLFGQQPVENSMTAEWTSAKLRGLTYGIKFTLTFGVGALGTQVVGWIWQGFDSLAPVFGFIALSAGVMTALALGISWSRPVGRGCPRGAEG